MHRNKAEGERENRSKRARGNAAKKPKGQTPEMVVQIVRGKKKGWNGN